MDTPNTLTEAQKKELIDHMNKYDNESFELHAIWAARTFGIEITGNECKSLYFESII